jgi:hypothetical protein
MVTITLLILWTAVIALVGFIAGDYNAVVKNYKYDSVGIGLLCVIVACIVALAIRGAAV